MPHHLPPCHRGCKHTHEDYDPAAVDFDYPPWCIPRGRHHGGPHGGYRGPCRWCRLWHHWLPNFASEPFFTDIARRYGAVHQHFTRTRRRHPLHVAADIREIERYILVMGQRNGRCQCGCGGLGGQLESLVRKMEKLARRLEDKGAVR